MEQHRELGDAPLAGVRVERDGEKRGDPELGQRGANQDVARGNGGGVGDQLRHGVHGEREELHHHRSVLLLQQGSMREPELGSVRLRRGVLEHQGDVRRAEPAGALRLQRHAALHQHHDGGG